VKVKKEKIGHIKEIENRISEIFTKPVIKDKGKKMKNKLNVKVNLQGQITYCEDAINIYTDGSKSKNGTGVVVYENHQIIHSESHKLNNEAIVYQAELFGIFRANCWIDQLNNKSKKFAVFVDNISSLKILKQKNQ